MPPKFRQRGKKKKTGANQEGGQQDSGWGQRSAPAPLPAQDDWQQNDFIPLDAPEPEGATEDPEQNGHIPLNEGEVKESDVAPFGFVSTELKAYLKEAHANLLQLDAAHRPSQNDYEEEGDDYEQSAMLRQAILREINGQELACATDGEGSITLETIIDGLDGRRLRILGTRISGSCAILAGHRFGSHVLQAILRGLQRDATTLTSSKGKRRQEESDGSSEGVLRSAEDLVLDVTKELIPLAQTLVQSSFGTHVVRTMLQILAGQEVSHSSRSKKSASFRTKVRTIEGETDGAVSSNHGGSSDAARLPPPDSFAAALQQLRAACLPKDSTGQIEARELLVSPYASPTFALLLSLEAAAQESARAGSLADIVLEGLISETGQKESKDGVETLLRHPSGSHAVEALLARLPTKIVDRFWKLYIAGKACRLACHPVANFVVARAAKRLSLSTMEKALTEIKEGQGGKMVKENKTGVLLALMERSARLEKESEQRPLQKLCLEASLLTFGFEADVAKFDDAQAALVFQCILALKTKDGWKKMMRRRAEKATAAAQEAAATTEQEDGEAGKKRKRPSKAEEEEEGKLRDEEVSVQGSVLLQALVRLEEYNEVVYKGMLALPSSLPYATNPTASHVYLLALSSPTGSYAQRRRLLLALMPRLHLLSDDKYGSRVSDAVWDRADGFMKGKIIKDLASDDEKERQLNGSFYGRFLLKRVGMQLYRKDMYKWKDWVKTLQLPSMAERLGEATEDGDNDDDIIEGLPRSEQAEQVSRIDSKKRKKDPKRKVKSRADVELDSILAGA